jgi:hypothetical protein
MEVERFKHRHTRLLHAGVPAWRLLGRSSRLPRAGFHRTGPLHPLFARALGDVRLHDLRLVFLLTGGSPLPFPHLQRAGARHLLAGVASTPSRSLLRGVD